MPTRADIHAAAARLVGHIKERPGSAHHPFIEWGHELCGLQNTADEVPWCSSGLNVLCFMLGAPRSASAAARSWLRVGLAVALDKAEPGDIVVFKRGSGIQPGKEVIHAPGHVAVLSYYDNTTQLVHVYGGNQANAWTKAKFHSKDILEVRRIA